MPNPRENIDESVRPQDNFYRYANGTWLDTHPIPQTEARWGAFFELREANNLKLKTIAEELDYSPQQGSTEQLVRDFYAAGMDIKNAEASGVPVLRSWLKEIDQIKNLSELSSVLAKLHAHDIHPFWHVYVEPDDKRSDVYILRFAQSGLGLPDRDYYTQEEPALVKVRTLYQEHITRMVLLAGLEGGNASQILFEIEHELAQASMTSTERRDIEAQYNKRDVPGLEQMLWLVDWARYFKGIGIHPPRELLVDQPRFFARVQEVLSTRSIADLKLYLSWHLIISLANRLGERFENAQFEFYGKVLNGTSELQPRWKRVVSIMDACIGEATGKLFVEKHYPPEAQAKMTLLVEDLRSAFAERIKKLPWMEATTKDYALEKLARVRVKIGFPPQWREYVGLVITPDNYVQNVLNAFAFEVHRNFKKLGTPVDREEWFMTASTVNAYAYFNLNEIVFPAGILQPPFFDFTADDAVNYGGIGTVIGHELTHGFDDRGSQYDAEGNLRNWRTEKDVEAFTEQTKRMVAQASTYYPLPGLQLNGELTLGENIADLGGAEIAFDALRKAWERNGKPEPIDGFTAEQRFFLAYAATECAHTREEKLREQIVSDPHSPGEFRVNGILSNVSRFYEAFNIQTSDPLYIPKEDRAEIW